MTSHPDIDSTIDYAIAALALCHDGDDRCGCLAQIIGSQMGRVATLNALCDHVTGRCRKGLA